MFVCERCSVQVKSTGSKPLSNLGIKAFLRGKVGWEIFISKKEGWRKQMVFREKTERCKLDHRNPLSRSHSKWFVRRVRTCGLKRIRLHKLHGANNNFRYFLLVVMNSLAWRCKNCSSLHSTRTTCNCIPFYIFDEKVCRMCVATGFKMVSRILKDCAQEKP
jgi:hypothetical protein